MSQIWREVSRESLAHETRADIEDAVSGLAVVGAESSRMFQSSTGAVAIVLSRNAVTDSPDLDLELGEPARDYNFVALVLQSETHEDVGDLLKYCDVIALPERVADTPPKGMVACGQLAYRPKPGDAAAFITLFCNAPADTELFSRGAPLELGEPDGNLDSREKWFKKRHGPKR